VILPASVLCARRQSVNMPSMQIEANQLPREKGSYLLLLKLLGLKEIQVGKLGRIGFKRGWYAYAGSAFGPGGLAARLNHHLRPVKKRHWHIDYLRAETIAMEVWMAQESPSREHAWASILAKGPWAGKWVRGFGCSDCTCPSHLLYFDRQPGKELIREKLGAGIAWLQLAPESARPNRDFRFRRK
jgi:Uri superfamily endonuclease